jgi:hypothetical protein
MGYNIGIARAANLFDGRDNPISDDEFRVVAGADPELEYVREDYSKRIRADGGVEETFHPWVYVAHPRRPSIWLIDGVATSKNADDQTIAKLFELAQQLEARVLGEEGEEYDADGSQIGFEEPAPPHVPWWRRIFGR